MIKQNQAACKQLVQAMIKQNQAHTVFAPQFDPQIPYSVNKLLIFFFFMTMNGFSLNN